MKMYTFLLGSESYVPWLTSSNIFAFKQSAIELFQNFVTTMWHLSSAKMRGGLIKIIREL